MKEYQKIFIEVFKFEKDIVTLSNGGDGGEVGDGKGDAGDFGNLFG